MNLKKLTALTLSATMILSLTACTSPKDLFSKILTGNGGNKGGNALEEALVTNKDAVFTVDEEIVIGEGGGFDYYGGYNGGDYVIKYANGKMWLLNPLYVYDEEFIGDGVDIPVEGVEVMPMPKDGAEPDDSFVEEGNGDYADENGVFEEFEGDNYDDGDFYGDTDFMPSSHYEISVSSFTNGSDMQQHQPVILNYGENASGSLIQISQDNELFVIVATYDYNTGDESYYLRKYDLNSQLLKETTIDSTVEGDSWFYISQTAIDKDGNFYAQSEDRVDIYDKELNKIAVCDLKKIANGNDYWCDTMTATGDGQVVIGITNYEKTGDNYKDSWKFSALDAKGNLTDLKCSEETKRKGIYTGGGYDIYFSNQTSIRAMNLEDTTSKEIVSFYDSDINVYDFNGAYFISEDRFVTLIYDNDTNEQKIVIYKKVPADQVIDKEVITIAADGLDYEIAKRVNSYNKASNQYKIKLVDYSQYNSDDDYSAGTKRFYTDLTTGNAADIIVPSWGMDINNLIDKGVFADLTPEMEANPSGLQKGDLVKTAQEMYADGDKLYVVFPNFSVIAFQMKKSLYDGELTMDDILAWEAKTGNKAFSNEYTSDSVLYELMTFSMDSFLDPKTGKCNFDSPEFISLLEYAKTYPNEIPEDYWENYDWNAYQTVMRSEQNLLTISSIYNFRDFNYTSESQFGEETVFTGLKFGDSDGAMVYPYQSMGISAKSKNKAAAWDFISSCFTEEYYEQNHWDLATLESQLDKQIAEAKEKPSYIDENGEKVEYDDTYYIGDTEYTIHPITDAKAQEIKDFITSVKTSYSYDEELLNILTEETSAYFQGQKSAKEVAGVIQSRLQIYVNEKK